MRCGWPSETRPGPAPRPPWPARESRRRSLLAPAIRDDRQLRTAVVVDFIVAEHHLVRRLHHAREQRRKQIGLFVDERFAAVVGKFKLVGHRQCARRARLDAESAQDAAQIVDLIDAAISFAGTEAFVIGVLGAFDVDGVRGARPGAEFAADALLQAVRPPIELVSAVETGRGHLLLEGVLLGDSFAEHRAEGDTESGDGIPERFANGVRHLTPPFGRARARPPARAWVARGSRRQRRRTRPARAPVLPSSPGGGTTPRATPPPPPPPS